MGKVKKDGDYRGDGLSNTLVGKGDVFDQEQGIKPMKPQDMDDEDLRNLVRGTGIASAIIDRPVDRSIRVGWSIKLNDKEILKKEMKSIKFIKWIKKALKYDRTYGGGLIVYGTNDSGGLETQLSEGYSKGIDFIRVYRREQCIAGEIVKDSASPRYGKPETYEIQATGYEPYTVHWSRCYELLGVPVDEDTEVENGGWGDSVIVSNWDAIRRYDDSLDTIKRIIDNYVNMSIEIDGLFDAIRANGENDIRKRLAFFNATMHSMNFAIHDKEEKIEKISSNAGGVSELFADLKTDTSTSSGIPARVLFGEQKGGLNNKGEGETNDWIEYIEDYLDEKALPIIEFTVGLMEGSDDVEVVFNDVKTPSAKEQAEIYKVSAEGNKINIESSVLVPEECRKSQFGGDRFTNKITLDPKNNDIPFNPQSVKDSEIDPLLNGEVK